MPEIQIPFRSEDAPITEAFETAKELPAGEREIVREITSQALAGGITTVGGLLDRLEELGPDGRRTLVDQARVATGRPTIGQEEAQAHMRISDGHPPRPVDWRNMHELAMPEEVEEMKREEERRRARNARRDEEDRRQAEEAQRAAEAQSRVELANSPWTLERTAGYRP